MKTNVFFLKTHKTAGTTVQNIVMRFGLKHELNFLLSSHSHYVGYKKPITRQQLKAELTPFDEKFNILAHHSRYNRITNKFLYPDTVRVTVLRNPADVFESLWEHYNLSKRYNTTIKQFIEQPETNLVECNHCKITGRNQMSRDLGFDNDQRTDDNAVRDFINLIDRDFHLVMIEEHLEESLVLFANLMNWPLEYVQHLILNDHKISRKYKLSDNHRLQLTIMNRVDTRLYSHFLDKFRRCVQQYGQQQMVNDVRRLRALNKKLENRCNPSKKSQDWECVHSTRNELEFTTEIRHKQAVRLRSNKKPR